MPTDYPGVVEDDFLLWIATRYVPIDSSEDGWFISPETFSRSVDEIIEGALKTPHSVVSSRAFTDQPVTIFNDDAWVIPPERIVRFDALVRFMYAGLPGLDEIPETNSAQWIGMAEAWMLREAGHGRQPEKQPRKRQLAGA